MCVWPYDDTKCNQFAINPTNNSEKDPLLCANHYANYRLNKLRKTRNTLKEKKLKNSAPSLNLFKQNKIDVNLLDSSDSLDQNLFEICMSPEAHEESAANEPVHEESNDQDENESSSYTREDLIKIFKYKLSKLQYLYKQQLTQLNDRLIYDRRVYLDMKEKELAGQPRTSANLGNLSKIDKKKIQAARRYKSNMNKTVRCHFYFII